ncbi:MAG: hypothetical protein JXA92_00860 [candidate division Zixibacteria bacterium]|nr:hypothetical protein [candidate division Zixibacteria bacterium]
MSRVEALKSLESLLENFLERAVRLKQNQLQNLSGINRLDDIARRMDIRDDFTEEIGNWFAEHNPWLEEDRFKPAETNRIQAILEQIRKKMSDSDLVSPEENKIRTEIDRWDRKISESRKLVLKRGSETVRPYSPAKPDPSAQPGKTTEPEKSTEPVAASIARFDHIFTRLGAMFADLAVSRAHLLSVLDDSLKKAETQKNKEALILSALIIYYLKFDGYKISPYVKRLKEAEKSFGGSGKDA